MSPRFRWTAVITCMLAFPLFLHGVAGYLIAGDPSFTIDPRYGRYAYDGATSQGADELARRGIHATLDTETSPGEMRLELVHADGRPVQDAVVEFETFHVARSALAVKAPGERGADGAYRAPFRPHHGGFHALRCRVTLGAALYELEFRRAFAVGEPDRARP